MKLVAAGLSPRSPTIAVVPVVEIDVFPRITKLPAVPRTTGAGPSDPVEPVVNPHTKLAASALPARSLAPVVIVAVYTVVAVRLLTGLKAAVRPAYVTVPDTGVVPCFRVNVAVVIVKGSIASLNVARIFVLIGTPVAAEAGDVKLTRGGVVSAIEPVVKLHTKLAASVLPAESLASVVIVAVCAELEARLPDGAKVAVVPV